MLLYFHSKNLLFTKHQPVLTSYYFPIFIAIVVSFRLLFVCQFIDGSWSTRQRVAGGQPTGDSDLQEASTDQRVDHVGGPTHGDKELQETSTGQRVEDVGGRTPQRKLEEQQGPHRAYPRNSKATYARLKAEFEEIVAVEKQYSPGTVGCRRQSREGERRRLASM